MSKINSKKPSPPLPPNKDKNKCPGPTQYQLNQDLWERFFVSKSPQMILACRQGLEHLFFQIWSLEYTPEAIFCFQQSSMGLSMMPQENTKTEQNKLFSFCARLAFFVTTSPITTAQGRQCGKQNFKVALRSLSLVFMPCIIFPREWVNL